MNTTLLHQVLDRISYKDGYVFTGLVAGIPAGDLWMIRVEKPNNVDAETGGTRHSVGRWNVVIGHSADEVARACLVAVKNFEEHEVHEWLRVDGKRIFNPHGVGS